MSAFTTDPFHTSNCRCCEMHARTMAERDVLKDELRRTCEHLGLDQLLAERDALQALLREFRKATQFESNGRMYTLSGIPRELTLRIDAALKDKP